MREVGVIHAPLPSLQEERNALAYTTPTRLRVCAFTRTLVLLTPSRRAHVRRTPVQKTLHNLLANTPVFRAY